MTLKSTQTVRCNKCTKTLSVEGSRGALYKQAIKSGWQWKSAKEQFCPDHKTVTVKKPEKKSNLKTAIKKASSPKPKAKSSSKSKSMPISGIPSAPASSEGGE